MRRLAWILGAGIVGGVGVATGVPACADGETNIIGAELDSGSSAQDDPDSESGDGAPSDGRTDGPTDDADGRPTALPTPDGGDQQH
jgi:hypothetical protein